MDIDRFRLEDIVMAEGDMVVLVISEVEGLLDKGRDIDNIGKAERDSIKEFGELDFRERREIMGFLKVKDMITEAGFNMGAIEERGSKRFSSGTVNFMESRMGRVEMVIDITETEEVHIDSVIKDKADEMVVTGEREHEGEHGGVNIEFGKMGEFSRRLVVGMDSKEGTDRGVEGRGDKAESIDTTTEIEVRVNKERTREERGKASREEVRLETRMEDIRIEEMVDIVRFKVGGQIRDRERDGAFNRVDMVRDVVGKIGVIEVMGFK